MTIQTYIVKSASELGVNSAGYFVIVDGKIINTFTGPKAQKKAEAWAAKCNHVLTRIHVC